MDIMNMTLNQILQSIPHHPVRVLMFILAVDNVLISAFAAAGWIKAETYCQQLAKFLGAILSAIGKKTIFPAPPKSGQTAWEFLLLIICIGLIGCALKYHGKTGIHMDNVVSFEYGHVQNMTINHDSNFECSLFNCK